MEIQFSDAVPDSTYFRVGDAEPLFRDGAITCLDGQGSRRNSWGAPGVTSTVVVNRDGFAAVHVGFYHKHGGSQFWRYYRPGGRVMWKSLSEDERMEVLDAWIADAPGWAKCPGKLRRDYLKPGELSQVEQLEDGRFIGYKWLQRDGGQLRSPWVWSHVVWEGGCLTADRVPTASNTNGIYAAKSQKDPELARYRSDVLVKLVLSGTVIEHQRGFRAECAEILEVLG